MTLRLLRVATACTIRWPSTKAEPSAKCSPPMGNQPLEYNNVTRLLAIPETLPKIGQKLARDALSLPMLCDCKDPLSPSNKNVAAKPGCVLK